MYRTIYNSNTGSIIICRNMSDDLLARRLAKHTDQASIDAFTTDIQDKRVDLETLQIVDDPQTEDLNHWLREKRKADLISCDWTQTTDAPLSDSKKAEWATYRQALRDLPSNYPNVTDKDSVTWPSKPS